MPEPVVEITKAELMRHNGEWGREKWIAYEGVVYDVTDCPNWRGDLHRDLHFPGLDLSGEIVDAPHGEEVFSRPCVRVVGKLEN